MNDLSDPERRALQGLAPVAPPGQELEERVVAHLAGRGLLRRAGSRRTRLRVPAILAACAASLVLGWWLRGARGAAAPASPRPSHLLLVGGGATSTPEELASRVAEYGGWARRHPEVVGGSHLEPGWFLEERAGVVVVEPRADSAEAVSGYFVLDAETPERAQAIARTCPHLRYGGWLELRAVE